MAAMLSSYTLLSRVPTPAPAKLSPATALQLIRKQPAAAASSVVALPWAAVSRKECRSSRRAPLFVCHAKHNYKDIQPNALETETLVEGNDWSIMQDKDQLIILRLKVGGSTSKDQLKVERTDDLEYLVIRYTGDISDESPASELDLRLKVPHGYDGKKVKAKLFNGSLMVALAKPKKHDPNQIFFHKGSFYYDANKIPIDD